MPYIGKDPGTGLRGRFIYTATAGQTTFSGSDSLGRTLTYTDSEYTDVYLNGVKLDKADYTATSGTSIVLDSGATAGDILEVLAFDTFGLFSGEFAQDVTVAGDLTVSGTTTPAATTMTGDLSLADKIVHTGDTNTAIRFPAADTVTVETAASERVRILSGGGLTFNGDTAAANALDDYEEGTWTPIFEGGSSNPTVTYDIQVGRYTKIGDYVSVWLRMRTDAYSGGSGVLLIGGLPFTSNSTTNFFGSCAVGFTGTWGNSPSAAIINTNNTVISLRKRSSTSVYSSFKTTLDADSSGGDVGTTTDDNDIILAGFYKV